ncbi:MAG: hypothetical protein ACWA42_06890 [Lutibacter sp.]
MKYLPLKNYIFLITLLFLTSSLFAQESQKIWVFGVGLNAVDYFPTNQPGNNNPDGFFNEITNAQDHWNVPGIELSLQRYFTKNLAFEGRFSYVNITKFGDNKVNGTTYLGFDVNALYTFLRPIEKLDLFAELGGGYTFAFFSGGTLNLGLGSNYWLNEFTGIKLQGMYKYNSNDFRLAPHFYYSFSVLFDLGASIKKKKFKWGGGNTCN